MGMFTALKFKLQVWKVLKHRTAQKYFEGRSDHKAKPRIINQNEHWLQQDTPKVLVAEA